MTDFISYIARDCKFITTSETFGISTTLLVVSVPKLRALDMQEAGQSPARGFRWLSGLDCYIAPGDVIITIPRQ